MKLKKGLLIIGYLGLMLFNAAVFSQDSEFHLITKELTIEQRDLLDKERELIKNNRETFKKSLTKLQ